MDSQHLRAFLKIADTGSITRAAESLGIAQPSLSQQLLRLEDELGFALFRRGARGVTLTEAGLLFREHAHQILRASEAAVESLRAHASQAPGAVVLAVPWSISQLAGLALVEAFRQQAPQVGFRLVEAFTGQIRGWLDAGKVDLGILYDRGPIPHLRSRPLAREELWLVGPAGRFCTVEAPVLVPVSDLAGLGLVLPGHPHAHRQFVEAEAARHAVPLTIAQEIDAMGHIAALVEGGYGYSILPLPACARSVAEGRVSVARVVDSDGQPAFVRALALVRNAGQVVTHASVRAEEITVRVLARLIAEGQWRAEPHAGLR